MLGDIQYVEFMGQFNGLLAIAISYWLLEFVLLLYHYTNSEQLTANSQQPPAGTPPKSSNETILSPSAFLLILPVPCFPIGRIRDRFFR